MNATTTQTNVRYAPLSVGRMPAAPWLARRGACEAGAVGRGGGDQMDATGSTTVDCVPTGVARSRREDTDLMRADGHQHSDAGREPWDCAAQVADAADTAAAAERRRLARDLHDSVTQTLLGLQWTAQAAADLWDTQPAQARAALDTIRHLAVGATVEMRALLLDLHDAVLEQQGLLRALEAYAAVVRQRSGLRVELRLGTPGPGAHVPRAQEEALYSVAREALTNVVKHARTTHATVTLWWGQTVRLVVEDEGVGFGPPAAAEPGAYTYGLAGMRERVAELGGRLRLENRAGGGARVVAELPVGEAANR